MSRSAYTHKMPRRAGFGTGTVSLLVIFTLLCLATLAMLSYSTVASNKTINERGFRHTEALAAAQGEAARTLAAIDGELLRLLDEWQQEQVIQAASSSPASPPVAGEYSRRVAQALEEMGCTALEEQDTYSFIVPIDENSRLVTTFRALAPGGESRYEVLAQSSVVTEDWAPEPGPGIWEGPNA